MNKTVVVASLMLLIGSTLLVANQEETININEQLKGVTLEVTLSNMNVQTKELLYVPNGYTGAGRKISELIWKADDVKLIGLKTTYNLSDEIGVFINFTKNLTNDGTMDDFDWLDNTNPNTKTNWSHHENTKVSNVEILDLGFTHEINFGEINTWLGLGYKFEKMEFKAYDGYGSYAGIPVNFSGLGITFEQEYKGPYIELGVGYNYQNFDFFLSTRYSPIISIEYTDRHHLRNPAFTEVSNIDDTSMVGIKLASSYKVDSNQKIKLEYAYTNYDYKRGDRIRSFDDGTVYSWENSTGMESKNSSILISYSYIF